MLHRIALFSLFASACDGGSDTSPADTSADTDETDLPVAFGVASPDFITDTDAGIEHDYDCHMALPVEFSCYNSNPEITWEGLPDGTTHLALIFDDPTAGGFPHWAVYNVPATETGLGQGISGYAIETADLPEGAAELENGFEYMGYLGSCPGGINQYRWRLWALNAPLVAPVGGDAFDQYNDLADQADAASIEMVEMCHVFDGADIP